ncbi:Shedu immune nuclease family protein [Serratia sp. T13T92]|uniref:Shedu immune nuclease family protein n=1 Tax=Serratia sp. T13T92 TaxID=3397496 RepID=UPI0039DF3590
MYMNGQKAIKKKNEYLQLLNQNDLEQVYQSYLENNTMFIPREFEQNHGIHFCTVFRKLPLSSDYKPDFVYLAKSSDNWNVVLVEIEKPSSKYFKNNSTTFHADFNMALQQMNTWRAWIDDESNRNHLKNNILQGFIEPAHMARNPFNFKYVLVHGRRSEYENNVQKTSLIRSQQRDDFSIISFDSLAENIERKYPLYIAVKKNTHFELISSEFVDEGIFSWVNTDLLAISKEIRDDAISKSANWHHYKFSEKGSVKVMDDVLPKIRII